MRAGYAGFEFEYELRGQAFGMHRSGTCVLVGAEMDKFVLF